MKPSDGLPRAVEPFRPSIDTTSSVYQNSHEPYSYKSAYTPMSSLFKPTSPPMSHKIIGSSSSQRIESLSGISVDDDGMLHLVDEIPTKVNYGSITWTES